MIGSLTIIKVKNTLPYVRGINENIELSIFRVTAVFVIYLCIKGKLPNVGVSAVAQK